jgi:outer membrane protein assembly factor BamB
MSMKSDHTWFILAATVAGTMCAVNAGTPQWPQFRGPNATGISDECKPPIHFGPETNLLWKTTVPAGISSPIVWGSRLFLTGVTSNELVTLAYDTATGRELWRRATPTVKLEQCHSFSSPAASTPCTDGERVYAYFGSYGVISYDFEGKEVWKRPFVTLPTAQGYGTATSPILAGGKLILQRDGESTNSQIIALAPKTGETVWESARPLAGTSFSTPTVWSHDGIDELMVQGKGRLAAYSLNGGEPKWWVRGWGFSAVTTPTSGAGMLFAGGSGMGDPTAPPDPLFDWDKNLARFDANKDGKLSLDEIPLDVIWHIRKDSPIDVPGNGFPLRSLVGMFIDTNGDKVVTKEEWDKSNADANDKFMADRFVGIKPVARRTALTRTWLGKQPKAFRKCLHRCITVVCSTSCVTADCGRQPTEPPANASSTANGLGLAARRSPHRSLRTAISMW